MTNWLKAWSHATHMSLSVMLHTLQTETFELRCFYFDKCWHEGPKRDSTKWDSSRNMHKVSHPVGIQKASLLLAAAGGLTQVRAFNSSDLCFFKLFIFIAIARQIRITLIWLSFRMILLKCYSGLLCISISCESYFWMDLCIINPSDHTRHIKVIISLLWPSCH